MAKVSHTETLAHRGYSHLFPENTLESFQGAYDAGVRKIELDVWCSKSGIPVVIHSPMISLTTDKIGLIFNLSLDEIKAANASFHFKGPQNKGYDQRASVPTLEEVCQWANGLDETVELFIELKGVESIHEGDPEYGKKMTFNLSTQAVAQAVYSVIKKYERHKRDLFISFFHPYLEAIRDLDPKARLGFSVFQAETLEDALQRAVCHLAEGVMLEQSLLSQKRVKQIHDLKLKVWAYTITTTEQLERCKNLGVDGVCLNDLTLNA